jgi:hypothetical protein
MFVTAFLAAAFCGQVVKFETADLVAHPPTGMIAAPIVEGEADFHRRHSVIRRVGCSFGKGRHRLATLTLGVLPDKGLDDGALIWLGLYNRYGMPLGETQTQDGGIFSSVKAEQHIWNLPDLERALLAIGIGAPADVNEPAFVAVSITGGREK